MQLETRVRWLCAWACAQGTDVAPDEAMGGQQGEGWEETDLGAVDEGGGSPGGEDEEGPGEEGPLLGSVPVPNGEALGRVVQAMQAWAAQSALQVTRKTVNSLSLSLKTMPQL